MKKVIGWLILSTIFMGLFAVSVSGYGIVEAILMWVAAIVLAVAIMVSIKLIVKG